MFKRKVIGEYIRIAREKENLTRERLAEYCDISVRCIYNIECGISDPRLSTIYKICTYCNIKGDDFLNVLDANKIP